ncbi:hypothetical protein K7432_007269 [Basidiobolus ranarum]|uniref:Putative ER transporter 6TM N-terminal domain-containing protein n=1 Tax=Basidiobolus ranarum TaxID=34480 RepID=A0ABR2WTN8_9FUNG
MSWEFDPQDVPLSRMLSNHSAEENRPGFFDLSTSDDIATRMQEYTQVPKQRPKNSLLNENWPKSTSSRSFPSTSQYLEPQHSHLAHSTNPIVTVTDWTDPLQAGKSYEEPDTPLTSARSSVSDSSNIPSSWSNQSNKDKHKQMSVCSDSLAEQDMEYDGKPPVLLDSQARSKQPVDIKPKRNFLMRILAYTKESVVNSLTTSAFHSLIRCLFAFVVISLLMIIPSTSRWIGPVNILTCSGLVFFPPIRTLGAQFEASVLGILFIMISCAYSYAALASLVAYNSRDNAQDYGAPLITAAFIIFATLVLGYLRTKYTRLYTPCVAAQVTLFFALFSNLRITELSFLIVWNIHKPLLLAVGITFLCSFFIFPQSATGKLADETQNALNLTSELLENISKTFLVAGDDIKLPEELEVTRLSLRSSLGSLNAVGREAMYELSVDRCAPWDYNWIGSTLTTVGQTLGSMLLLVFKERAILPSDPHAPSLSSSLVRNDTLVVQIRKNQEFSISDDRIYKALLNTVRDPVARIVRVCCRVISHIQDQLKSKHSDSDSTGPNGQYGRTDVNTSLVNNSEAHSTIDELEHAIKEFDTTEVLCRHALKEMGLDTKPRDELFMVFTFLFCIREIARKLLKLAKFQKELCKLRVTKKRIWWPAVGIFTLLSAPRYDDIINTPEKDIDLVEQDNLAPSRNAEMHQHLRYRLWQFLMWFQNPEFKFSIKFTLALCLVAIPAFVSSTYDWFLQVHGNWGLVTVCLVMNQTVGSTISVGIYRIIGTIVGGFWGYLGWLASQGNPYIIAVFTYVIAIPCWYFFITKPQT